MKCQNLFSGKNDKKTISICRLLKTLPSVLSVKSRPHFGIDTSEVFSYSSAEKI